MGAILKLDARTILVMTAMMGPLMAVVLYSMRRNYPVSVRGLGWWAGGALVQFVGIVLIATRDVLPTVISILLGNVLMMAGSLMWVAGTEKFLGRPSSMRIWLPLLALVSLAVAALLLVWPDYVLRVLVINGSMIAIALLHSHRLVLHSRFEFACRFLVLALMASACAWLVHATGAVIGYTGGSVFAPTSFNVACNAALTVTTLLTLIGFVLLASERVRDEFERLATRDSLTGALMRRAWNAAAQLEMDRHRRHGRDLSLVAMDLDYFKRINDTFGHQAGDKALMDFVDRASTHLRSQDQMGRLGGEEFVLLLPETSAQDAWVVAERIRYSSELAENETRYTVSIGIATLQTQDHSLQALLARADEALYRAKANGRNRIEFA
nr:GGDEF domain-containing protein [uncultured Rhodoferax sp.]